MRYLIVFILFISFYSSAQDDENGTLASQETEVQAAVSSAPATEQIEEQGNGDTQASPSFDVFRPSEDISEDLAVPFPADI